MKRQRAFSFALLLASAGPLHSQPKPAATLDRFQVTLGGGFVYDGFGVTFGAQGSSGPWIVGARWSALAAISPLFPSRVNIPSEELSEFALILGYGLFGKRGYLEFLVGPSYSFGTVDGNLDSVVSAGFRIFGPYEYDYYEPISLHHFGLTPQIGMGLYLGRSVGLGSTLFATFNKKTAYAGVSLDLIVGILR